MVSPPHFGRGTPKKEITVNTEEQQRLYAIQLLKAVLDRRAWHAAILAATERDLIALEPFEDNSEIFETRRKARRVVNALDRQVNRLLDRYPVLRKVDRLFLEQVNPAHFEYWYVDHWIE